MRARLLAGFSLMEMMVVLLIVAIIAAASAPMVSKKMSRGSSGESPWVFTGLGNSIAYNMSGDANSSAIIGSSRYTRRNGNSPTNPRLVIASGNDTNHPALAFADSTGRFSGQINMNAATGVVTMNDQAVGNDSVALGLGQTITGSPSGIVAIGKGIINDNAANAISIGSGANAANPNSIAIGKSSSTGRSDSGIFYMGKLCYGDAVAIGHLAQANDYGSIAIGYNAKTRDTGSDFSIAIGAESNAAHNYSVAIGHKATTTGDHQIVLGSEDSTVYIPGNMVVGGSLIVGANTPPEISGGGFDTSLFLALSNGHIKRVREEAGDSNILTLGSQINNDDITLEGKYISDRRLKNVGAKYTAGLAELKKLDFFHYTFKKDESKTPRVGVMAQDLQKVFPDAVVKGDDGYLRIRLEDMFYAVINAVKELDTKVTKIIEKLETQEEVIVSQQKEIEALKKQNEEILKQNAEILKELKKLRSHD